MKSGKVVGTEEMPVGVHMSVYELLTDYLKLNVWFEHSQVEQVVSRRWTSFIYLFTTKKIYLPNKNWQLSYL